MPDLSFVIPVYNEARFISKCLATIKRFCLKKRLNAEIIVINNGSTDDSVSLAADYADLVFSIGRSSVSVARNIGIEKSQSKLIAFIDADVMLTQEWFDCFEENFAYYLEDLNFLTGFQYAVRSDGTWIEQHWFNNLNDALLNGGNIITSKQVCETLNGFDDKLKTGEDYDFCRRALQADVRYKEEPEYIAIHEGFPQDIVSFFRREYWHGEGDFLTFKTFVRSPVAIIGVGYLVMLVMVLFLLADGLYLFALYAATALLGGNLAITIKRFDKLPLISIGYSSVLNFIYFCARGMSLFKALYNRGKTY